MVTFNYGLASVMAVLKEAGHSVELAIVDDYTRSKDVIRKIIDFNSDIIGISCMSNYWQYVKNIARKIKSTRNLKNIPIFVGGPHAIVCPLSIAETEDIEGFCIGEGEYAFLELVSKVSKKENYLSTDNFYFKTSQGVVKNRIKDLIEDLDRLPFPDRESFPDNVFVNYANFTFSRGCPYSCTYCCNSAFHRIFKGKGKTIRHRSVPKALQEIEMFLKCHKADMLSFDDDCFNKNPRWFKDFCSEYKYKIGIPYTCNTRPELLDTESARFLSESGCKKINIGIESGDEVLRKTVLNRNINDEDIVRAFDCARENKLKTMSFNIVGFPGETRQSIRKTIDLNKRIRPDYVQVSIFYPYAGTPLGEICKEKGYLQGNKYQFTYFGEGSSVLRLPGISKSDIKDAYLRFDLELYNNGNNFKKTYRMKKMKNMALGLYKKLPLSLKNILRAIKRRRAA